MSRAVLDHAGNLVTAEDVLSGDELDDYYAHHEAMGTRP